MIKTYCTTMSHNNIERSKLPSQKQNLSDEEPDKWLEPEDYKKHMRLVYINSFRKPVYYTCPECDGELEESLDEDETLCKQCGLVTSASIEYVAGIKIILPHGRH